MPFRDDGYSQADFILNVQDVVYGVWRAKERGLVNLREFVLDEYALQIRLMWGVC
jgi:cell division cycle 14